VCRIWLQPCGHYLDYRAYAAVNLRGFLQTTVSGRAAARLASSCWANEGHHHPLDAARDWPQAPTVRDVSQGRRYRSAGLGGLPINHTLRNRQRWRKTSPCVEAWRRTWWLSCSTDWICDSGGEKQKSRTTVMVPYVGRDFAVPAVCELHADCSQGAIRASIHVPLL
jgi:hypothetical protein